MRELDLIVLAIDRPDAGLARGDVGTIVMIHAAGRAYEVEFVTLEGETVAVLTLSAEDVRPIGRREIAHARAVA